MAFIVENECFGFVKHDFKLLIMMMLLFVLAALEFRLLIKREGLSWLTFVFAFIYSGILSTFSFEGSLFSFPFILYSTTHFFSFALVTKFLMLGFSYIYLISELFIG